MDLHENMKRNVSDGAHLHGNVKGKVSGGAHLHGNTMEKVSGGAHLHGNTKGKVSGGAHLHGNTKEKVSEKGVFKHGWSVLNRVILHKLYCITKHIIEFIRSSTGSRREHNFQHQSASLHCFFSPQMWAMMESHQPLALQ